MMGQKRYAIVNKQFYIVSKNVLIDVGMLITLLFQVRMIWRQKYKKRMDMYYGTHCTLGLTKRDS